MSLWHGVAFGQDFVNNDLNGPTGVHSLPTGWSNVPHTYQYCLSKSSLFATPDLSDTNGPVKCSPYSGSTYLSGAYGYAPANVNFFHEGIQQTVSGFSIGCEYQVNFNQALLRTIAFSDTSGGWAVYVDDYMVGFPDPSVSNSLSPPCNLQWEYRSISFTASKTTHTIRFLQKDDDTDFNDSRNFNNLNGSFIMAIDSIYITKVATQFNFVGIDVEDTTVCYGDTLTLSGVNPNAIYLWQDSSTNSYFNVTQPGLYWCKVIQQCGGSSDTLRDSINVFYHPQVPLDLGLDSTLCRNDTLLLNVFSTSASYLWSDSTVQDSLVIDQPGTYWVEKSINNCPVRDSIEIAYNILPINFLGPDTTLCETDTLLLDASTPGVAYDWHDHTTNSTNRVFSAGKYWLNMDRGYCTTTDSINVSFDTVPIFSLGNDTLMCQGDTLTLDITTANFTYLWGPGNSTDSIFHIVSNGLYWAQQTNGKCSFRDSIDVFFNGYPKLELGENDTLCYGDTIELFASARIFVPASYLWNDNSTDSNLVVTSPGTYWVAKKYKNCTSRDTVQITYHIIPPNILGNDTTLCNGSALNIDASIPDATYLWNNNSTSSSFTVSGKGTYWLKTDLFQCSSTDTIEVDYFPFSNINLGPDKVAAFDEVVILDAGGGFTAFLWSTGETTQTIQATKTDRYSVVVTDSNNCNRSDDIQITFLPPVGIENQLSEENVSLFPNPNNGKFSIDFGDLKDPSIRIFSSDGKLVKQIENIDQNLLEIELNEPKGIYTMVISAFNQHLHKKLVIR